MRRHFLLFSLLQAASLLICGTAAAADNYPNRPIRMVVGYPAGSGIDTVARQVAHYMEKSSGQTIYIDNKAGALGNIAALNVATAQPDGYTILFTPNSAPAINKYLFKKMPFDPVKDFIPVAPVATLGFVILVNPQTLPVKNLQELTALMKKNPGKYSYGTGNATGQVAGALYSSMANVDVLNVPYKGVPEAVIDLLGGRLQFVMADASFAVPLVNSGKLKALAVTNKTRVQALKDIPTMEEGGVAGYDLIGWFGIFLPAKASPEISQYLAARVKAALTDRATVESLRSIGVEPWLGNSQDLAKMITTDSEKWGRIIKSAGITAE
ncbi:MAG TPA: tripartite tricarboxylate transporter substrate binding protein [Herbaspirillum sp.]|jgi:tripartite-type tricarboxylate transporter receptor subunit TctC